MIKHPAFTRRLTVLLILAMPSLLVSIISMANISLQEYRIGFLKPSPNETQVCQVAFNLLM